MEAVENEDQEAQMMKECGDSSDNEDYPLLGEWQDKSFGNLVIQDIRGNEYEYRENEVVQRVKYPSIKAVKVVVKLWAILLRKEFRVVKSISKEYEVKCVNGDCTWRVHAYKSKYKKHCKCSIVTPHSCRLTAVAQNHRNITSTFVAK